jgi:hypothetical protein
MLKLTYNININYNNLRKIDVLKNMPDNWVLWGLQEKNDKLTKPPINPKTFGLAMSNNSNTWADFETTKSQQLKNIGREIENNGKKIIIAGIGLMLPDTNLIFGDIDNCLDENNKLSDTAEEIINTLNTYVEISPSGKGLRFMLIDDGTFDKFRESLNSTHYKNKNPLEHIEIYSQNDNRYCTLTGNIYNSSFSINTNMNIKELYKKFWQRPEPKSYFNVNYNTGISNLSDQEIFDLIMKSKNANKFQDLYYHPGQDGNSEGDMALAAMLAFYTKDHSQIKRMIINSSRNRDKFRKHPTYLDKTINTAINTCKGSYDPNYNKKPIINNNNILNGDNCQQSKSYKAVDNVDNLDLKKIKWHPDYCFAKIEVKTDGKPKKVLIRLSEFWKQYPDKESQPKMVGLDIMHVTENVLCLLKHYNIVLKYNVIRNTFDVFKDGIISKYNLETFFVEIRDKCEKHEFNITKEKLTDILIKISLDNEYNPIENYLKDSYKYYCSNPDKDIFYRLMNTIESNSEWKEKFIGKFLLQMIYLVCSDDDSQAAADYMLVLQGPQFIGKTTWLRNLLPDKFRSKYFLGGRTLDPTNKDDRIETLANWLVEMGEISSTFRKADQEALKNFITDYKDKFRLPYAKEAIERKRRTSLCGTTNDNEYLKDLTGTRRFLTLNCKYFDKEANIDIDMLWGYMYSLYLKGKTYKFTNEEVIKIMDDNEEYINKPEKLLMIEDTWDLNPEENEGEWLTGAEIYSSLSDERGLLNKFTIGRELKKTKIKWLRDKHLSKDLFYVKLKSY